MNRRTFVSSVAGFFTWALLPFRSRAESKQRTPQVRLSMRCGTTLNYDGGSPEQNGDVLVRALVDAKGGGSIILEPGRYVLAETDIPKGVLFNNDCVRQWVYEDGEFKCPVAGKTHTDFEVLESMAAMYATKKSLNDWENLGDWGIETESLKGVSSDTPK